MTKLSAPMARTLLTATLKGGKDETAGRGVPSVEALERKGFVKITHRARNLTNMAFFEVTDLGLEAAVELEDQGVKPYGVAALDQLDAKWTVTI